MAEALGPETTSLSGLAAAAEEEEDAKVPWDVYLAIPYYGVLGLPLTVSPRLFFSNRLGSSWRCFTFLPNPEIPIAASMSMSDMIDTTAM